jgi:hypothetical protein
LNTPSPLLIEDLDSLDYEQIVALVERLEYEPGPIDFKEVLNPTRPGRDEALASLRRTASAMANTNGGWIVFGVKDRATGLSPRERAVGISLGADLRKQFGDKMRGIAPEFRFEASPQAIAIPGTISEGIFVVRIPLSLLRPHMVTETGAFFRGGDGGAAERMNYYEVRDQMLLTNERLQRLMLLRLELAMYRQICGMISSQIAPGMRPILTNLSFDVAGLKALMSDAVVVLPNDPSLIRVLLQIPVLAASVNRILDLANNPSTFALSTRGAILDDLEPNLLRQLQLLAETCEQVSRDLDGLFGPLHLPVVE